QRRGKDGIFIKEVVPESPAFKNLHLKEGDQVLSATVYFDNIPYEDAIQILEHAQAYKVKLCLKRKPELAETEGAIDSDAIPVNTLVSSFDIPEAKLKIAKPNVQIKPFEAKLDIKTPEVKSLEADAQLEGQSGKFKIPRFTVAIPNVKGPDVDSSSHKKDIDVTLPEAKIEVELPKAPTVEVDVKPPEYDVPKVDVCFGELDVKIPEARFEVEKPDAPDLDVKPPSGKIKIKASDIDVSDSPSKFKMPMNIPHTEGEFGIAMPKMSAPEIDLSLSKKDVEVTLPEAKVEGQLADVEVKAPSIEGPEIKVETKAKEGSPSKLKMPTFKLPKIGISIPESEIKVDGAEVSVPQVEVDLPDVKADVNLPEVEIKAPSGELEMEKPSGLEMDAKFRKPKFSLPKFSFSKQSVSAPEVDISAPEVNIPHTEGKFEGKGEIDVSAPELEAEIDGQGNKFKLPKFGITMPKISAPDIDLSLSKKDVEVTIPETKVEGKLPDVEVKAPSIEAEIKAPEVKVETKTKEGSPSKLKMPTFKFPKFGASIPEAEIKVDGAEVIVPQVDVDFPDIKAEVNLPEVEIKAPSGELEIEQPSGLEMDAKFKKPRFSLPRFSFSKQSVPAPEVDISAPEVNIPQTEGKVKVKGTIDVKPPVFEAQIDGKESQFKLPKFGITMPKISKDVEVTLPEAKVEGKLPDVEVKAPSFEAEIKAPEVKVETKTKEGSPSKLKMPTFKLPKFGASIPEAEIKVNEAEVTAPKVEVDLPDIKAEVNLPEVEIKAPSGELEIEQPSGLEMDAKFKKPRFSLPKFSFSKQRKMDVKAPEVEAEIDGQGNKFKLPKFGITMPKISAPDIDLSLSKKDVEVTLPVAKVEGKLPDVEVKAPSIEAEIKAPEVKVETKTKEGSPSKLKMPTFKFPKFGASIPEAEIKVDGAEVTVSQVDVDFPDIKAEVNLPEVEIKAPSGELEIEQPSGLEFDAKFKKPRFSLPRFSFSKQSVPAPEVDISAPEVNISHTEGKVEVKGEMDVKAPEVEAEIDGQGNKFKLPKFGITMPKISAPDIDLSLSKKDVEVTLPETKEGSPSKLKMPTFKLHTFGASIPEAEIKVDGAEVIVPQVDVDFPDIKAEVNLPEVEIKAPSGELEIEQPSGLEMDAKFKKPRFSLPKFSFSKQSVSAPEVDISAPEVTIPQTQGKIEVKGEMDVKAPEVEAEIDGQGSKFKLPKFGITMPKISAPDIDLSLSKKDVEVTLPEAKVEGKLPDVEVKAPSIEAEIKAPEVKVETKTKDGSPSKLKMPTFKLPKFGASIPEAEIKVDGAEVIVPQVDVDLPDIKADVNLPEVEIKAPSGELEIEQPSGLEFDAKFKKPRFSLPRFSFSKQSVPAPEV
uniref:PDZ domain-containing protein n=1 Tax=Neogobius melanostomus TaxID=47308 RepID=A0A8C6TPM8_9GOBI